jgi:hypothetical protein
MRGSTRTKRNTKVCAYCPHVHPAFELPPQQGPRPVPHTAPPATPTTWAFGPAASKPSSASRNGADGGASSAPYTKITQVGAQLGINKITGFQLHSALLWPSREPSCLGWARRPYPFAAAAVVAPGCRRWRAGFRASNPIYHIGSTFGMLQ